MRFFFVLLVLILFSLSASGQGLMDHKKEHGTNQLPVTTGLQKYDLKKGEESLPNLSTKPVHDNPVFGFVYFDRFEQRLQKDENVLLWDVNASLGGSYHKLILESEGEMLTKDGVYKDSRNELLYSYALTAFWDVTLGYRRDIIKDKDDKNFAVIGTQGMAPFHFEVDASSYISEDGDLSIIAEIEYNFQLTQRTKFIPRIEMDLSFQDVDEHKIQSGLTHLVFGGRLSYELTREFAPYVGVSWKNLVFETANIAEAKGRETSRFAAVVGIRLAL